MLDESRILDDASVARYGRPLPGTLIRSTADAAGASTAAVLRAPTSTRS